MLCALFGGLRVGQKFFTPSRTVTASDNAVIGPSSTPRKAGNTMIRKLSGDGFQGEIYPANPGHSGILGLRRYASVIDRVVMVSSGRCEQRV